MSFSPSWTLCRGCTLWERAGSPGSCSHSGPPALCSTLPRSWPRPPGDGAAPPRTRPSWSTRCHTHETPSGTLTGADEGKKGRWGSQTRNEEKRISPCSNCTIYVVNCTWEGVMAKRQAAESRGMAFVFFNTSYQLTGLHYLKFPEFPSYRFQCEKTALLVILYSWTKDHSVSKTPEQMVTTSISHSRWQVFTGSLVMHEWGLQLSTMHHLKAQRSVGFSPNKHWVCQYCR